MHLQTDLIARLCQIARAVNFLIDKGEHLHPLEVRRHLFDGDLIAWLDGRYKDLFLGLASIPTLNQAEIAERFEAMAEVRVDRRSGVENNGLCILMALCIEAIQRLSCTD